MLWRDAKKAGLQLGGLPEYSIFSSQMALDQPVQESIDKIRAANVDPFAQTRTAIAQRAIANMNRSIAAEARAPARAGLVAKLGVEELGARSLPTPPPESNDLAAGLLQQHLGMSQEQMAIPEEIVVHTSQQIQIQAKPPLLSVRDPDRGPGSDPDPALSGRCYDRTSRALLRGPDPMTFRMAMTEDRIEQECKALGGDPEILGMALAEHRNRPEFLGDPRWHNITPNRDAAILVDSMEPLPFRVIAGIAGPPGMGPGPHGAMVN